MPLHNVYSKMIAIFFISAILFAACTLEDSIEDMRPIPEGSNTYIVRFEANGGIPEPVPQTLEKNSRVEEPQIIIKENHFFDGWYRNAEFSAKWNFTTDTVSSNITLYARWQEIPANSRLVTFNANGGTPVPPQQIVTVGEKINKPSAIAKTGHVFDGWYRNASLTNKWDFDEDTVSASIVLYAAWNPIAYTVLYDANGGEGDMPNSGFIYGISQKLPANAFIRTGHTFIGWALSISGQVLYQDKQEVQNLSTVDGAELTLFAVWRINSYTVAYNANGGNGTMQNSVFTYGVAQNLRLNAFTRIGYSFTGWSRTASGQVEFADGTNVSNLSANEETIILYAQWKGNNFTITYNPNGGTGTMENSAFTYGVSQNLRPNTFTRIGYGFIGWSRTETGQTEFTDGASVNNLSAVNGATVTLYAVWQVNNYTVSYNSNNGAGSMENSVFSYGVAQNLRLNAFTRTGYSFTGWSRTEKGEVEFTNGASVNNLSVNTETITLYAQWEANNFFVSYNSNGGSGTMESSTFTYDVSQNLRLNTFIRTGHTFTGWAYTQSGTVEFTNGASVSNLSAINGSTVTLYAVWRANSYTVTYNANGGNGTMAESNFTYGIAQQLRANTFTRADHTFTGWATTENGQVVYTNQQSVTNLTGTDGAAVTLYAAWHTPIVPGETLAAKLEWLQSNALSNNAYTVEVSANEIIDRYNFSYTGKNNISITIKGIDSMRVIAFSTNGDLFTVSSGVTLILDNNITLQGRTSNTGSVVRINSGGALIMNSGAVITGNTNTNSNFNGGGICINGGTFTMNGGTISDNTTNNNSNTGNGGGVYIISGTFTMNDGNISDNRASYNGGGVYINNGTFTMNEGSISGNRVTGAWSYNSGGGVYVNGGFFNLNGGTVSSNLVTYGYGGGIYVYRGTFIKTGNSIITGYGSDTENGNRARPSSVNMGHAVYVDSSVSGISARRMESTVGEGVDISYYYNNGSPVWWGNWE